MGLLADWLGFGAVVLVYCLFVGLILCLRVVFDLLFAMFLVWLLVTIYCWYLGLVVWLFVGCFTCLLVWLRVLC